MTDLTESANVDTVVDAAIRDAALARDTVMLVPVEEAARLAGVSVRTIRRWIQHGHLPHVEDENGKRVSPADLPLARERARGRHDRGHRTSSRRRDRRYDTMEMDRDTAGIAPAVSSSVAAQMEAIRDQWVRPLVDRIEELSRENGRLEQERDALRVERDQLRLAVEEAPEDANAARRHGEEAAKEPKTLIDRLRRLFRR